MVEDIITQERETLPENHSYNQDWYNDWINKVWDGENWIIPEHWQLPEQIIPTTIARKSDLMNILRNLPEDAFMAEITPDAYWADYIDTRIDEKLDQDEFDSYKTELSGILDGINGRIDNITPAAVGWNIVEDYLYSGSGFNRVELCSDRLSDYFIWAGDEDASNASFSVKKDGEVKVKNINITNNIVAHNGTINELEADNLQVGNVSVSNDLQIGDINISNNDIVRSISGNDSYLPWSENARKIDILDSWDPSSEHDANTLYFVKQ